MAKDGLRRGGVAAMCGSVAFELLAKAGLRLGGVAALLGSVGSEQWAQGLWLCLSLWFLAKAGLHPAALQQVLGALLYPGLSPSPSQSTSAQGCPWAWCWCWPLLLLLLLH